VVWGGGWARGGGGFFVWPAVRAEGGGGGFAAIFKGALWMLCIATYHNRYGGFYSAPWTGWQEVACLPLRRTGHSEWHEEWPDGMRTASLANDSQETISLPLFPLFLFLLV